MSESIHNGTEIQSLFLEMCRSIAAMQREYGRDWYSSREIAKYQEGSEELVPKIESLFDVPGADYYLVRSTNGRRVALTDAAKSYIQSPEIAAKVSNEPVSQQVASAVKAYARGIKLLRFNIETIHTIAKVTKRYVHAIKVDLGDTLLPSESPAHVISEPLGRRIHGRIVGQDARNGTLYVALDSSISAADLPARLEIDRAFLLYQLADALSRLPDIPERGQELLQQGQRTGFNIQDNDSGRVADQLARLQPPWTHFLWGPPGAGKTYGMARLMLRLLESEPDQRILLVAPSNIAVDVALQKFVELVEGTPQEYLIDERHILRYGYPQKSEILSRPELLGSEDQEALSQEIGRKEREIRKSTKADSPEDVLAILRADLLDLQERLKSLVLSHVSDCSVVATTTTMAYLRGGPIVNQQWDTILVDEVTMVPPAVCLYLSSLAGSRLLFAGDPRQLGPIYEGRGQETDTDQRWMGQDVYNFTGLAKGSGEKRDIQTQDPRLVCITSQRRCTEAIWKPIRHLYNDVKPAVDERALHKLHFLPPDPGRALVTIDTGRELQQAVCEPHRRSWWNPKTGAYAVRLAQEILDVLDVENQQTSISIITPYRAQYRMIRQKLKEIELHHQVEVGTIHRFQGSEADVVIFDLVDGPGRKKLGALLRGDGGIRLVNVAISRARGKLIILGDKSWCKRVMQRRDNPLLWDLITDRHRPSRTLMPERPVKGAAVLPAKPAYVPPKPVKKEEPVLQSEVTVLTTANVTAEIICSLAPGQSVPIESKAAKRKLNQTLSSMNYESVYDEENHKTLWRGPKDRFHIDHNSSTLTRDVLE